MNYEVKHNSLLGWVVVFSKTTLIYENFASKEVFINVIIRINPT